MDISRLINKPESRKIREVIKVGGEIAHVYEPTKSDIDKILELQEKWKENNKDESLEITIDGYDVIRTLIPLLTDIEGFDNATDEELQDIIDNPSLLFIQIEHVIETIIAEVFRMVVLSQIKHLVITDSAIKSEEATMDTAEYAISNAMRETGDPDLARKVYDFAEEASKRINEHNLSELNKEVEKTEKELITKREHEKRYYQYKKEFFE